jgi:hypothetical protein
MQIGSCKRPNVIQNKILYTLSSDPKARELKAPLIIELD